jgi:hypothetical protein
MCDMIDKDIFDDRYDIESNFLTVSAKLISNDKFKEIEISITTASRNQCQNFKFFQSLQ